MKSKHTDEQLNWLRSRLPEYESRAAAQVRGDAKGFALRCAEEYIEKWGLGTGPDAEKESQVKERIYTWFKNTSARGKEARRKHAQNKNDRESSGLQQSPGLQSGSYSFINDPSENGVSVMGPGSMGGMKKSVVGAEDHILPLPYTPEHHSSLQQAQNLSISHSHPHSHAMGTPPQINVPVPVNVNVNSVHAQQQQQQKQQQHLVMQYAQQQAAQQQQQVQQQQQQQHPQQHVQQQGISPASTNAAPSAGMPYPALINAFLQPHLSSADLANLILQTCTPQQTHHHQYYAPVPNPSSNLSTAIHCLMLAATQLYTTSSSSSSTSSDPSETILELLKRYKNCIPHMSQRISHFGRSGPEAGLKALRVALRKNSVWVAYASSGSNGANNPTSSSSSSGGYGGYGGMGMGGRQSEISIHDQMHRTSVDRYRRKEYFIWAMIHSAAYEVGLLGGSSPPTSSATTNNPPPSPDPNSNKEPTISSMLSLTGSGTEESDDTPSKLAESIARDGLWENDESDWVAGALLLRGVIRRWVNSSKGGGGMSSIGMGPAGMGGLKREWEELVAGYEARWKDVRDEGRQAAMEDALNVMRKTLDSIH